MLTLLEVATTRQWLLYQINMNNAFLNRDTLEEIYMRPPPKFSVPIGKVCHLHCVIYGLKQAPPVWFAKFNSTVTSLGFISSSHDSTLSFQTSRIGITMLLLYFDDMIITGDDAHGIRELNSRLQI